jgi:hypothetical protein
MDVDNKMTDLTIIFLTNSRLPEAWQAFHREKLLEAIGDTPVISLSREPLNLGINILQDQPPSKSNIFYQMLRGMRLVKTPYVAIAEDDCLYPKEHFEFRPPEDSFAYNYNRWSLYSWNPVYSLKNWIKTGAVMIAPTKLALEVLEERFKKYPYDTKPMPNGMCGELGVYEAKLGLTPRKVLDFKTEIAVVQLDHDFFTINDPKRESVERRHTKELGYVRALSIPYWGSAKDLTDLFHE